MTIVRPLAALAAMLGPSALLAEIVEGRVVTEEGAPVPGLPVIIEGAGGSFVALTDQSGQFQMTDLPPGEYTAVPPNGLGEPIPFSIEAQGRCFFCSARQGVTTLESNVVPQEWQLR